jgi:hypothetical protein
MADGAEDRRPALARATMTNRPGFPARRLPIARGDRSQEVLWWSDEQLRAMLARQRELQAEGIPRADAARRAYEELRGKTATPPLLEAGESLGPALDG